MSLSILIQGEFQIITELTVKIVFLMFILLLPICSDTITPTGKPLTSWSLFHLPFKTQQSLVSAHTNH